MTYYEVEIDTELPTDREKEVLRQVAQGMQDKEIARALGITKSTVQNHLIHIYRKLKVSNRTMAARWALDNGILNE